MLETEQYEHSVAIVIHWNTFEILKNILFNALLICFPDYMFVLYLLNTSGSVTGVPGWRVLVQLCTRLPKTSSCRHVGPRINAGSQLGFNLVIKTLCSIPRQRTRSDCLLTCHCCKVGIPTQKTLPEIDLPSEEQ